MEKRIREFMEPRELVLVGASANPEKYGNVILKNLIGRGYKVIPVNPKESEIEGVPCYPSLSAIPGDKPFVNFVLPASATMKLIPDLVAGGCRTAWLQPGAESPELVSALEKAGIRVIADGSCIMVIAAQL